MKPIEKDQRFLTRRVTFVRAWPVVGNVLMSVLVGLTGYLIWNAPILSNPVLVMDCITSNTIPESNTALSILCLPILVLLCMLLTLAIEPFTFVAIDDERKYLAIIEKMKQRHTD